MGLGNKGSDRGKGDGNDVHYGKKEAGKEKDYNGENRVIGTKSMRMGMRAITDTGSLVG